MAALKSTKHLNIFKRVAMLVIDFDPPWVKSTRKRDGAIFAADVLVTCTTRPCGRRSTGSQMTDAIVKIFCVRLHSTKNPMATADYSPSLRFPWLAANVFRVCFKPNWSAVNGFNISLKMLIYRNKRRFFARFRLVSTDSNWLCNKPFHKTILQSCVLAVRKEDSPCVKPVWPFSNSP